jgi:hypothetical protein
MTPQEKAKELYCKYTDALNIRDLQTTANPFAKQCALIAVNEIIKAMRKGIPEIDYGTGYWSDVRNEIEKL